MTARAVARRVLPPAGCPQQSGRGAALRAPAAGRGRPRAWSEAASLAVSELVTNAVLHAHSDVEIVGDVRRRPPAARGARRQPHPAGSALLRRPRHHRPRARARRRRHAGATVSTASAPPARSSGAASAARTLAADDGRADELLAEWDDARRADLASTRAGRHRRRDDDGARRPARHAGDAVARRARAPRRPAARAGAGAAVRRSRRPACRRRVDVAAVDAARAALDTAVDAELERARDGGTSLGPAAAVPPGGAAVRAPTRWTCACRCRAAGRRGLRDAAGRARRRRAPGAAGPAAGASRRCRRSSPCATGPASRSSPRSPASPGAPWPGADDERFTADVDRDVPRPAAGTTPPCTAADVGVIAVDESNRVLAVSAPLAARAAAGPPTTWSDGGSWRSSRPATARRTSPASAAT